MSKAVQGARARVSSTCPASAARSSSLRARLAVDRHAHKGAELVRSGGGGAYASPRFVYPSFWRHLSNDLSSTWPWRESLGVLARCLRGKHRDVATLAQRGGSASTALVPPLAGREKSL